MVKATIFFNADQGGNGNITTANGGVEITEYNEGIINLSIRGPRGGIRHIVLMPTFEAVNLGRELLALEEEAQKKAWGFVEQVSRLRISDEVGCPDCGGPLGEEGVYGRECLNCGETWPLDKIDEWRANEAFDFQEALNRLIGDARDILTQTQRKEA